MKIEALLKSGAHVYEPGTMYPYPFIWLIYNDYDPEEAKEIAKLLVEYKPPFPVTYQWPRMWTKEPGVNDLLLLARYYQREGNHGDKRGIIEVLEQAMR